MVQLCEPSTPSYSRGREVRKLGLGLGVRWGERLMTGGL